MNNHLLIYSLCCMCTAETDAEPYICYIYKYYALVKIFKKSQKNTSKVKSPSNKYIYMCSFSKKEAALFFVQFHRANHGKKQTATASPTKGGDIPTTYSTRSLPVRGGWRCEPNGTSVRAQDVSFSTCTYTHFLHHWKIPIS